jgi:hypothetical protein
MVASECLIAFKAVVALEFLVESDGPGDRLQCRLQRSVIAVDLGRFELVDLLAKELLDASSFMSRVSNRTSLDCNACCREHLACWVS